MVDTSVWIDVFRDRRRARWNALRKRVGPEEMVLTRFQQLELLQGGREEREWALLDSHLGSQEYAEARTTTWVDAARTYFDLRRQGKTVRSPIDCCIAQIAIEHDALLLHVDGDFETIASIRPLRQEWPSR